MAIYIATNGEMTGMRWVARTLVAMSLMLVFTPVGVAAGDGGGAVLLTPEVDLKVGDDGAATTKLSLLDVTTSPIQIEIETTSGPTGCGAMPTKVGLVPGQQQDVEITLSGCQPKPGDAVTLRVTAPDQSWSVQAKVPKKAAPPWWWLGWSFGVAAVLAGGAILAAWLRWEGGNQTGRSLRMALPNLKDNYDFSKSWASNATLISGAFAAVFGASDVLKAILGDEDASVVAVVVVAAAVASAFVIAGPFLVAALRSKKENAVTCAGLLGAAFVTITGTGTQLGVLLFTAWHLDIGDIRWFAVGLGVVGALLLLVYVYRSLTASLTEGEKPHRKRAHAKPPTRAEFERLTKAATDPYDVLVATYPAVGTSPGDDRRSALL
jgi:hypothetical protein